MTPLLRRRVSEDEAGQRLGVLLAEWLSESRSRAQHRVVDGLVRVDGALVPKSHRAVAGEEVVVLDDPVPEVPAPPVIPVRWADEHLLVVLKPADVVVHDGAGVRGSTLVDGLIAQGVTLAPGEDPSRPGIVHRLDRGTSGLLVVALTDVAMTALQAMFKVHDVVREYWALVEGHPDPVAATIDAPIARSTSNRTAFTTSDVGRDARTHYTSTVFHADTTELLVTLETGRTHQVRVHMRAIGRPVAGDILYGASTVVAKQLGLQRQALHAKRLAFTHPITGEDIDLTEPLPDDLALAQRLAGPTLPGPDGLGGW